MDSGTYIIRNVLTEAHVGPAATPDHPGHVISLPKGSQPPHWVVKKLTNGHYLISTTDDACTGAADDLIYLFSDSPGAEWIIQPRTNHGPDIYTIEKADGMGGWVLHSIESHQVRPGTEVACKVLVSTRSIPPQYFPEGLWVFDRTD